LTPPDYLLVPWTYLGATLGIAAPSIVAAMELGRCSAARTPIMALKSER